jgi:hypothetical protein
MDKMPQTLLLEVDVVQVDISSWEWRVYSGDKVHVCGFAETQLAARFAGNDARFLIFASGQYP